VSPENEIDLRAIQKLIGQQLPELPLPGFDRDGAVAEAEAKTAAREASKDSDIVAAKKEMAKKARRKNRAKAREEAEREARAEAAEKKAPAKLQLPRGPKKPKTTGGQKRERGASKAAAAGRKAKGVATAGRPDMRPGRAHRAAQAQARKRWR